MTTGTRSVAVAFGLAVLMAGCSPEPKEQRERAGDLHRRIATADRVVARSTSVYSRLTLMGDEVALAVRAISTGKWAETKDSVPRVFPVASLEYYKGAELVGKVGFSGDLYEIGGHWYQDTTGWLEKLSQKLNLDKEARKNGVADLREQVLHRPELAGIQAWSVDVLARQAGGEIKTRHSLTFAYPEILPEQIPTKLAAALPGWEVFLFPDAAGRPEGVLFSYYGACGYLVGPTNYTTGFEAWYITNAAPGIYVFHMGH